MPQSASLLQLKTDALERFKTIKGIHAKMQKALASKGSQDKAYLKLLQQLSDELMNIRFTSRSIERLCDSVRGMVEQVRGCERKIQQICVDRVKMPRPHFIQSFPGNEINLDWVDAEVAAAPQDLRRHPDPQCPGHQGRAEEAARPAGPHRHLR